MAYTPDLSNLSNRNILECCGLSTISDELFVCGAEQFVSLLNNVLSALSSEAIVVDISTLSPLFFLAALHQIPGSWHSADTRKLSKLLLQQIYSAYEVNDILSFLTTTIHDSYVISELFKQIQQLISTNGWENSPTVRLIATWIQSNIPYPTLGTYLNLFFPILLRLLDDLTPDNQVIGLKSTIYMTRNVTKADLVIYNRLEVLLHALERYVYSNYSNVLSNFQLLMVQLLSLIEQPPNISVTPLTIGLTHHDTYLYNLLSTIPQSYSIELKRDRVNMLSQTVPLFESALLPHLSQLVKAIVFFLALPDLAAEEVRYKSMDLVLYICQHCAQQIHIHLFQLSLALIKVITQCSQRKKDKTAKNQNYHELAMKSITCFQQLYGCEGCGDALMRYLIAVCEDKTGSVYVSIILRKAVTRLSITNSEDIPTPMDAI
ncbi:TELO2-interacting protein 2-like [Oopsacas minuta]|uniref:TELO2-interacting protein 2-like n=1 Tax=Oopsacas minuta TaxID=111878 RepID=A0AAV7K129_9METZ|nr:TELO2-interacting protein 2-like [Oopsacas minuta]